MLRNWDTISRLSGREVNSPCYQRHFSLTKGELEEGVSSISNFRVTHTGWHIYRLNKETCLITALVELLREKQIMKVSDTTQYFFITLNMTKGLPWSLCECDLHSSPKDHSSCEGYLWENIPVGNANCDTDPTESFS